MGNTLTCCGKPDASPSMGRRSGPAEPDDPSEVYEAAAGDAVAVAPSPAAPEPAELDFGTGEGHHLQHISDREMPDGKEAVGGGDSRGTSGLRRAQGPPGGSHRLGPLPARSRLSPGWHRAEGWLRLASPPLSLSRPAGQCPSSPPAPSSPSGPFSARPARDPSALRPSWSWLY